VPQAEHELQLEVWKELAVSKQILMRTTATALKLDPDCTDDELRRAVEQLLKSSAEAEASAVTSREQARASITAMEHKLADGLQAKAAAEAALAQMRAFKEKEGPQLAAERAAAAKELQKVKEQLAEKTRALKAVTTALADSPENVLKKLRELKKQKQEEADARKVLEASLNSTRHAKRESEQKTKAALANATKLATLYRDLHALAVTMQEKVKAALAKEEKAPVVPELDEKLLEGIDAAAKARDDQ
jgi:chromosome segregation ATPase